MHKAFPLYSMIHRSVKVSCNNLSWTSSWGCVAWQQKQTTQILAASSHPQKPHKEVYPDNKREPPLLLFIHRTCLRRVRKLLQSKKRSLLTRSLFFKIAKRFLQEFYIKIKKNASHHFASASVIHEVLQPLRLQTTRNSRKRKRSYFHRGETLKPQPAVFLRNCS